MFCEKCGTEITKGAKFCEKCGASIEPELQKHREGDSRRNWILGSIMGGIFIIAVVVVSLLATGVPGGGEKAVQTNKGSGMQSDKGISDATAQPTEQPTEQPMATPVVTSSPVPEPTESPVEGDEPEELTGEDVSDNSGDEGDLTGGRTPEETYKQYIETFVESVNTGNTDELSQTLSGKICKQQCDLVENYYNRGIQEELQSYSISSTTQINDSCTRINAKETIKVFYEDGSTKVIKQKYCYVCKYIDSVWMITSMKETK